MELKKGIKLKSKWFKGITVIDHVNEEDNDLEVNITNELGHTHHENWNLQHTIWGLESGDYWQTEDELPKEKKEVPTCPKCGCHNIHMFDSDNDYCTSCMHIEPAGHFPLACR